MPSELTLPCNVTSLSLFARTDLTSTASASSYFNSLFESKSIVVRYRLKTLSLSLFSKGTILDKLIFFMDALDSNPPE